MKDPILFGGGDTNLYGYVLSDPVNEVDPGGGRFDFVWPAPEGFAKRTSQPSSSVCDCHYAELMVTLIEREMSYLMHPQVALNYEGGHQWVNPDPTADVPLKNVPELMRLDKLRNQYLKGQCFQEWIIRQPPIDPQPFISSGAAKG